MKINKRLNIILIVIGLVAFFAILIVTMNYKTTFSDIPYPATIKKVNYEDCTFTISYGENNPKSENYGKFSTDTLQLYNIGKLSNESCKCVEDALKFNPKGIGQFRYEDYPYYSIAVKDNQFNIDIEIKETFGTTIVNFNNIVKKNKENLCQKWDY